MRPGEKLPRARVRQVAPVTMTQQLQAIFWLMEQKSSLNAEGAAQAHIFRLHDGLKVVGNNGQTEVRVFHKETKIGPYTQNFIDRGRSIYDAALSLLNLPKGRLTPELMTLWDNFSQQIKNTCQIDPERITQLRDHPQKTEEYFNELYKRALFLLGQLCVGLIKEIKQYRNILDIENEDISSKELKKDLRKQETELIKSKGRSNLVNVIDIDDRPTQLVSCLSTITSVTTPSNIASEGNRNLVREDRYIKSENRLVKVGTALRLGAISSFDQEDEKIRKWQNAENAKELIQVAAAEKITSDGLDIDSYSSENAPLQLNIFSSTLLSPYKEYLAKFLDNLELIPSELQMVLEHHESLMLYHDRIFPLEVTLNNGVKKTIYIQPKIIHFNVPANINVELQHELISEDQNNINAQGGFEYLRAAENFLKNQWLRENQFTSETPLELQKDINDCKVKLLKAISIINENKEVSARLRYLNEKLTHLRQRLAYENRIALEFLNQVKLNPSNRQAFTEYQKYVKSIQALNNEIYESYREIYEAYNRARKQEVIIKKDGNKVDTLDVAELFGRNYENIESLLLREREFFSKPENFAIKQQMLVGLAYINSQRMMFDEHPDLNYRFKENALLMLAYMHATMHAANNITSYGCKSAKDRTGLLNIYKDAITVFAEQYGIYPNPLHNAQAVKLQKIIAQLMYKSPCPLNSAQNDPGAFGLQLQKPYGIAKAMGVLAKGAYSEAVSKFSILQANLDPVWQNSILPQIKNLIELDIQFVLSNQKDKEILKKIKSKQDELKTLCGQSDLFDNIANWSANYLSKDEYALQKIMELKLLEQEKLVKIIEQQHDAQAKLTKMLSKSIQPIISIKKIGSKEEDALDLLVKEIDYLAFLLAEKRVIKNKQKYLVDLRDINKTDNIIQEIFQLERFEIPAMEKILLNAQNEIDQMLRHSGEIDEVRNLKNNLGRCLLALLIQKAKFNAVLPNNIDYISYKDLTYQLQLAEFAHIHLKDQWENLNNERKSRKEQGLPNSLMIDTSINDVMSYIGNIQGYMRVLSDAKLKLEESQKKLAQQQAPIAENESAPNLQNVMRGARQRIIAGVPDPRKIVSRPLKPY